ncbi:hypothetical protein NPIL_468621, partial [Nephila pilipes]
MNENLNKSKKQPYWKVSEKKQFLDETITHEKKLKKTMAYTDLESSLEHLLNTSETAFFDDTFIVMNENQNKGNNSPYWKVTKKNQIFAETFPVEETERRAEDIRKKLLGPSEYQESALFPDSITVISENSDEEDSQRNVSGVKRSH